MPLNNISKVGFPIYLSNLTTNAWLFKITRFGCLTIFIAVDAVSFIKG